MQASVLAVSLCDQHHFHKINQAQIELLTGLGVKGDVHMGKTVKHRSRVRRDPTQPNLRQIHLIHRELHEELLKKGFELAPGEMGENITTQGIDLLGLPKDTQLHIGPQAIIQVTGLRNPCSQLDDFQKGLMSAVLDRDEQGQLIRKAGIMGIVIKGGIIRPGDSIEVQLPALPHLPLDRV